MAELELYTKASTYIDSGLLSEATNVSIKRMTNSQMVETLEKGYAGESPGAGRTEITVETAVPAADFEYNPQRHMSGLRKAQVMIVLTNGKTLNCPGFIVDDNFSDATNSASKLTFTFRGPYREWE